MPVINLQEIKTNVLSGLTVALVMVPLVFTHGVEYLFVADVLMGL